MNKWLPYPKNKPEKGAYFVTVQWNNWRGTQTAFFNGKEWRLESPAVNTKVIAYMEAPEPYEGNENEDQRVPETCNLCGGRVERVYNNVIYWKSYGSGVCYKCLKCGAFVGTHIREPKRALGILANKEMRELTVQCHTIFDALWDTKRNRSINRSTCYEWLSIALDIPKDECHFGWFDTPMLKKALKVLQHQGFTQSAKLLLQQHKKEATAMLDQVIQDVNQTSAKCGKRWSVKRLNKRIAEVRIKNEVSKQKDRLWPLL